MTDNRYGTPFVETELLLSTIQEEWGEVDRLLETMNNWERQNLRNSLKDLIIAIEDFTPDEG